MTSPRLIAVLLITALSTPLSVEAEEQKQTSPWQSPNNFVPFDPSEMKLMTDGTVIFQDYSGTVAGGAKWWKYTPDNTGSYVNGTWSEIAPMPPGYAPLYYASAVLPSGKVIAEGGEYNHITKLVWQGRGALYDPLADTWTPVSPPKGMSLRKNSIGDAEGIVLPNGTFMLSPVYYPSSGPQQLFDPTTLTWTATGQNKAYGNGEAGQVLLPNGKVLTVDMVSGSSQPSEIFDPGSGEWSSAGDTKVNLVDGGEIGPMVLRPNGTVFVVGASGHNAVYDSVKGTWSRAPDFPVIHGLKYETADGPAALLPSGRVLVIAAGHDASSGSHFFIFDGSTLARTTDSPDASGLLPYYCRLMVLPTGQIMALTGGRLQIYTEPPVPGTVPNPSWAPTILSVSHSLMIGTTYQLRGLQLSGLSQGAGYGDDFRAATNFPLIRIVNRKSGHVYYARTFDYTSASVAPNQKSQTSFVVPPQVETGKSLLTVVANGIASQPVTVTIAPAATASVRNARTGSNG